LVRSWDTGHALVAALGHDGGRAERAGELLPRRVTAHRDDPLRTHLPGGEHAEEADRTVAHDHDRAARLHIRRVGGEPAGAQDIGGRQQARDQVVRRQARGGHQGAVRERDAQPRRLRAADELGLLAGRLVAVLADGAGVVGREERADDELARPDRPDRAADFLDDAAIFVPHRCRRGDRLKAAIGPKIGATHAGRRDLDDGVGRLDDPGQVAFLEAHIARAVKDGSLHGRIPSLSDAGLLDDAPCTRQDGACHGRGCATRRA
jgi:hypothetical protein